MGHKSYKIHKTNIFRYKEKSGSKQIIEGYLNNYTDLKMTKSAMYRSSIIISVAFSVYVKDITPQQVFANTHKNYQDYTICYDTQNINNKFIKIGRLSSIFSHYIGKF